MKTIINSFLVMVNMLVSSSQLFSTDYSLMLAENHKIILNKIKKCDGKDFGKSCMKKFAQTHVYSLNPGSGTVTHHGTIKKILTDRFYGNPDIYNQLINSISQRDAVYTDNFQFGHTKAPGALLLGSCEIFELGLLRTFGKHESHEKNVQFFFS